MERTCVPSRLSIRLPIDSESFRELTGTNDLPSSLQKKSLTKSPRTIYTQAFLHLEVSCNKPSTARTARALASRVLKSALPQTQILKNEKEILHKIRPP